MKEDVIEMAMAYWAPWDQREVRMFQAQGYVPVDKTRISHNNEYIIYMQKT